MAHPRALLAAARPFGFAAALVLIFMMFFTSYSVIMRQVFGVSILGVVDIMELALVMLIFIALPGVFLRDANVTIDVIDQLVPRRVRVVLRLTALLFTLGFLVLMMVRMLEPALSKLDDHEVTMTLGINRFIHWIPILFGFAFSILATTWVFVYYLVKGVPTDSILSRPDQSSDQV